MARPSYEPDAAMKGQVETMAAYGIPESDIAAVLRIDPKTLRKHFRDELDLGHTKANAQVAGFLFNAARNGNVTAQIFWLKTRARWKETSALEVTGSRELVVSWAGQGKERSNGSIQSPRLAAVDPSAE